MIRKCKFTASMALLGAVIAGLFVWVPYLSKAATRMELIGAFVGAACAVGILIYQQKRNTTSA